MVGSDIFKTNPFLEYFFSMVAVTTKQFKAKCGYFV